MIITLVVGLSRLMRAAACRPDSSSRVHTSIRTRAMPRLAQATTALAAFSSVATIVMFGSRVRRLTTASRARSESSTTMVLTMAVTPPPELVRSGPRPC